MSKAFAMTALAALVLAAPAHAQSAKYGWIGYGVNVPGSSKCPTYKMTIDVTVAGDSVKALFQQEGLDSAPLRGDQGRQWHVQDHGRGRWRQHHAGLGDDQRRRWQGAARRLLQVRRPSDKKRSESRVARRGPARAQRQAARDRVPAPARGTSSARPRPRLPWRTRCRARGRLRNMRFIASRWIEAGLPGFAVNLKRTSRALSAMSATPCILKGSR